MKKLYGILIFFTIISCNNSDEINNKPENDPFVNDKNLLIDIIDVANKFSYIKNNKIKYSKVKTVNSFDFISLKENDINIKNNKIELYYNKNEISKIIIKGGKIVPDNTIFYFHHTPSYCIIYPRVYFSYADNILKDVSTSGFFFLNKENLSLYFFSIGNIFCYHKIGEIELNDIRTIMVIDSKLRPTKHIQFIKRKFFISTNMVYREDLLYYEKVVNFYDDINYKLSDSTKIKDISVFFENHNNRNDVVYPRHEYKKHPLWTYAPHYQCIAKYELEVINNKLYDIYNNLIDDTIRNRLIFSDPYLIEEELDSILHED